MTTPTKPNEESDRLHGNAYLGKRIKWVLLQCAESSNPNPIKPKTTCERLGSGLGHAFCGAVLGAVMGFVEPYLVITACAGWLGFMDQDGMIVLAGVPFGAIHGAIVGLLVGLGVRGAHGWVVGALVGLGFWAPLFLLGAHNRSNVIELKEIKACVSCGAVLDCSCEICPECGCTQP